MKKIKSAEEHDPAALAMAEQHLLAVSGPKYSNRHRWAGPDTAEKLLGQLRAALLTWLMDDGHTSDEHQRLIAAQVRELHKNAHALGMKTPLPPEDQMSVPAARRWVYEILSAVDREPLGCCPGCFTSAVAKPPYIPHRTAFPMLGIDGKDSKRASEIMADIRAKAGVTLQCEKTRSTKGGMSRRVGQNHQPDSIGRRRGEIHRSIPR